MLSVQETIVAMNMESTHAGESGARRIGARQFRRAWNRGRWGRLWNTLAQRRNYLSDLAEAVKGVEIRNRHDAGIRAIPIDRIHGSEGRSRDFDSAFFPLSLHNEERWLGVASAYRLDVPLPPVELIQIGENYFVRDGHHRISVARALGQKEIEAHISVWEIDDQTQ